LANKLGAFEGPRPSFQNKINCGAAAPFDIAAKKTLCELKNLCNDSGEFNKCKGGDPVSRKVLERGVGTAWEVAR
jgi:hypothetical protein